MLRPVSLPEEFTRGNLFLRSMPGRLESLEVFGQEIAEGGIRHVMCLVSDEEIARKSPDYLAAIREDRIPAKLWRHDIPDYGMPENMAQLNQTLNHLRNLLDAGESVVIHCAAGLGRTGMISTLLLVRMGMPLDRAIETISLAGSAPDTKEQGQFLKAQATPEAPLPKFAAEEYLIPTKSIGRIAILSDIHGNLPALGAVLEDAGQAGVDRFVCLGDTVGYGASPAECIDRIRGVGAECVMGNHDLAIKRVRMVGRGGMSEGWERSGYAAGLVHAAETLGDERASWLAELPYTQKIPSAVVAHANYHDPESFDYIMDFESAGPTLGKLDVESGLTGFFGHTHIQEVFPDPVGGVEWLDGMRFHIPASVPCAVMVGSVGQPRHAIDLRAAWVLWDTEQRIVELRKTNYPRLQAARDIIAAGLPLESAMKLLSKEEAAFL